MQSPARPVQQICLSILKTSQGLNRKWLACEDVITRSTKVPWEGFCESAVHTLCCLYHGRTYVSCSILIQQEPLLSTEAIFTSHSPWSLQAALGKSFKSYKHTCPISLNRCNRWACLNRLMESLKSHEICPNEIHISFMVGNLLQVQEVTTETYEWNSKLSSKWQREHLTLQWWIHLLFLPSPVQSHQPLEDEI